MLRQNETVRSFSDSRVLQMEFFLIYTTDMLILNTGLRKKVNEWRLNKVGWF